MNWVLGFTSTLGAVLRHVGGENWKCCHIRPS